MMGNSSTQNSITLPFSPKAVYKAFTTAHALENWLAPDTMTAKVHQFDFRKGGGYEMSLYYNDSEKGTGKTSETEDRYTARYIEIIPERKIIQGIIFQSANPDLTEEMIMDMTLEQAGEGTDVTFRFTNIPPGIHPEDYEEGTILTLEKLAKYVAHISNVE